MASKNKTARYAAHLRKVAMGYPETVEDFPWGHPAYKVRKKVFLTLVVDDEGLRMSMKLPDSRYEALLLPFTEPTHYGLGKHGWVSSKFGPSDDVPIDLIEEWIEESFRAIAPKKVVALLENASG